MKVKVNDTIYDAEEQAIAVILDEQDKKNIQEMKGFIYAAFPDTTTDAEIDAFLDNVHNYPFVQPGQAAKRKD